MKRWYVVHAYSGFEKSVAQALRDRIVRDDMQERFGDVLVPTEEVIETVSYTHLDVYKRQTRHRHMITDDHVVRNLDLIVQFDAVTNHRVIQRPPINRRIGADFDVITNDYTTDLRNLDPALPLFGETKTIATDNCSSLNKRTATDHAMMIDDDVRIEQRIVAN